MKNKLILLGMLLATIISCTVPRYLPISEDIDINQFGSYIDVDHITESNIKGELIAIDSSRIFILTKTDDIKEIVVVQTKNTKGFKLKYAKPKNYGWTIPLYTLVTISHGYWAIISAPVNLIVTISVAVGGKNAFTYDDEEMTFEKLKMFSRFPQGIPPSIDLANIK